MAYLSGDCERRAREVGRIECVPYVFQEDDLLLGVNREDYGRMVRGRRLIEDCRGTVGWRLCNGTRDCATWGGTAAGPLFVRAPLGRVSLIAHISRDYCSC